MQPAVSIVLVNWHGLADTLACLESLTRLVYPNASVIVVDNGSAPGEAASVRNYYPAVTVLEMGRNLGFTGGNNVGIRHALGWGADYILCLNNDTVVDPDFLGPLVDALETDPKAGIAAAAIYYHDDPERLAALGTWVDLAKMGPVGPITDQSALELDEKGIARVQAVDGCVLMMRRTVAEATGGFDDRYFAYVEDVDLCLRARGQGWHCLAVPAARVWHKVGSTTGGECSPTATHYYLRNCLRLVRRHGTPAERRTFRAEYGRLWRGMFVAYLCEGRVDRAVWREERRSLELLDCAANVFAGLAGFTGNRQSYRAIEAVVRALARLATVIGKISVIGFYSAYRSYRRLYRKTEAQWPQITRLLPKPL